jgi:hypothetical protein
MLPGVQFERLDVTMIGAYPYFKVLRDRLFREDCYVIKAPFNSRYRFVDNDINSW